MKKLIIIFLLSFIASYSFAQQNQDTLYPSPPQNLGGLNVAVRDTGGLFVRQTMVVPIFNDTASANASNPYTKSYTASQIYTRDIKAYWFRQDNPRKWVIMGSSNGNNNIDTIFTKIPIFVDTVSQPGRRILTLLHLNGLESGGVVTLDSCMSIDVTPAIYYLNYLQYTTVLKLNLPVQPADIFDRTDAVVADSNLNITILKGLVGDISPYINPSSQVLLATIHIPANATCLSISQEVVFDGIGDNSGQWTHSTFGTITTDFVNTVNPFHLVQDLFIQTYTDSSGIIFTKPSGTDTVKSTSVLKIPISVNGAFTNQIQGQWFNGSTAVSNNLVLNPYFNPNDSNFYQLLVAPFNIWNFSNTVYNRFVLTFRGQDISGGKGLYSDYIQIQSGVNNNNPQLVLTTLGTSGAATYDNITNILNIPVYGGGGGSETMQQTFNNSVTAGDNPIIDGGGDDLTISNILNFGVNTTDLGSLEYVAGSSGSVSQFHQDSAQIFFNYIGAGTNTIKSSDAGVQIYSTYGKPIYLGFNDGMFNPTPVVINVGVGAPTDSVLTRDAVTGIVNMRDPASFFNLDTLGFTANLLIYTNTLTPTGVLANEAAFKAALIGDNPGDNNDSVVINGYRIVNGFGTGEVGLIEISVSRLMVIPEGMFRGNTEITGFEDLGSLLSSGSEIRQGAFKNSTLKFFSAPFFGDIASSNIGDSAFYNCNNLNYVYLPAWHASDVANTFQSCDVLSGITVQILGTSVSSIAVTNNFTPNVLANGPSGQTTLVSGTKALTIAGVTASSRAFITLVSPSGVTLTTSYQAVCTSNTLTIQANVAAGTINVADGSTLNYLIIN